MIRRGAPAVLALVLVATPAAAQRHARLISRIDSLALETLRRSPAHGLAVGVARGNETMVAKGYGFARPPESTPATERTIYPIASITKSFTAAAVLKLAEDRHLRLSDPVARHLRGYPEPAKDAVTVKHLLGHTSGTQDSLPAAGPPGMRFIYANAGYDLLGSIIATASGRPYLTYLRDSLFDPVGLRSTDECQGGDSAALGYELKDDSLVAVDGTLALPTAAGGLCSNVVDLLAWGRALQQRKVINNRSWHDLIEPVELKDGSRASYGLGVTVGRLGKFATVGHGGATPGFSGQWSLYPDQGITVVVLANSSEGLTRRLADQIARLVLGVVEPRVKDLLLPADRSLRYSGTYILEGDSTAIEVRFRRDHIWARLGEGDAFRLLHQGSDEFVSESDPTVRFYFRVRDKQAHTLEFRPGDLLLLARLAPLRE